MVDCNSISITFYPHSGKKSLELYPIILLTLLHLLRIDNSVLLSRNDLSEIVCWIDGRRDESMTSICVMTSFYVFLSIHYFNHFSLNVHTLSWAYLISNTLLCFCLLSSLDRQRDNKTRDGEKYIVMITHQLQVRDHSFLRFSFSHSFSFKVINRFFLETQKYYLGLSHFDVSERVSRRTGW